MGKTTLQPNDKIWYIEINSSFNSSRKQSELYEATIEKVTAKNIFIKRNGRTVKVDKITLRDKVNFGWGATIKCYLSPSDYYNQIEYEKLRKDIIKFFERNHARLTLDEMRSLYEKLVQSQKTYKESNNEDSI